MQKFILILACFPLLSCERGEVRVADLYQLPPDALRGRVIESDANFSMIRAEVLACGKGLIEEMGGSAGADCAFAVQAGDLRMLSPGFVFRAKARETFTPAGDPGYVLAEVWPDDRAERMRVNNVNRLLRRDTLSLGEDVIRSVGDALPPFALYDQDGKVLTTDYFDGSVTVLNFIFTRCSIAEMCPSSTRKMKKLQVLAEQTEIKHVRFLSITLDPSFDSPGVLKTYARAYQLEERNFRLGTASKGVIDDLARQFGILRKNVEGMPLDHTMRTMIVNAKRQIIYQFPSSHWSVEDFLARLSAGLND